MAKGRHKKKAKRNVVGLGRKVKINAGKRGGLGKIIKSDENKAGRQNTVGDLKLKVQFTETNLDTSVNIGMNNLESKQQSNRMVVKLKGDKSNDSKPVNKEHVNIDENNDEGWLYPTEIDGETCIDIQCGANDALMYLDRLCVGSQGACIKFVDSWLTPNEFQMVSGRETAKDWKRSIRHKGRNLKLLINKGLINLQSRLNNFSSKSARTMPLKSDNTDPKTNSNDGDFTEKSEVLENIYSSSEKSDGDNALQTETQSHRVIKRRGRKTKTIRCRRFTNRNVDKTRESTEIDATRKTPDVNIDFSDEAVRAETVTDRIPDGTNNSEELDDGDNSAPTDTRTEEERRLDDFVKSLRLTKTNGETTSPVKSPNKLHTPVSPAPLAASFNGVAIEVEPTVTACTPENGNHLGNVDEVDPEMPILQKETDVINGYDAVNTTVTPPPTPPSDRLELDPRAKSLAYLNHIETFKSTSASPSNGLELTVNREKVNCQQHCTNNNTRFDLKSVHKLGDQSLEPKPEAATRALLLQDALKSARKYKEQLQQGQLKSPIKSTLFMSKATVEPIVENTPAIRDQYDKKDTMRITNECNDHAKKSGAHRIGTNSDATQRRPTRVMTPSVQLPSVEDIQRHSAKSLKGFMSAMGSVSGSLPINIDKKDAAASTLREFQLNYDMLRMLQTQGQLCMTSPHPSSLLYPMATQQLLLAMTKQLQSIYNIPDMPVTNGVSTDVSHRQYYKPPMYWTSDMPNSKPNSLSSHIDIVENRQRGATPIVAHKVPKAYNNDIDHLRNTHSMQDSPANKRKYDEADNGGALDLSMKKPRTVVNSYKSTRVLNIDEPLDFSLKQSHSSHSSTAPTSSCTSYSSHRLYSSSTNETSCHPYTRSNVTTNHTPVTSMSTNYRNQTNPVMPSSGMCTCSPSFSEMTSWSVDQVCSFLTSLQGCASYTKTFREQGISGRLLPYLTSQHLVRTLGMASLHATSLMNAVGRRFICSTCRSQKSCIALPTHS